MSEEESETHYNPGWVCPHDGSPLVPVADTPHWFHCGADGWKHYFYQRASGEGGGWVDVDTNQRIRVGVVRRRAAQPSTPPPKPSEQPV